MNANKVLSANDLSGRIALIRIRSEDPNPVNSTSDRQMICSISEVNAQGLMITAGPKNSVSRFIPWWNVEYVQTDAAIMDEEGQAVVDVGCLVQ